jgi:hypothetical protein
MHTRESKRERAISTYKVHGLHGLHGPRATSPHARGYPTDRCRWNSGNPAMAAHPPLHEDNAQLSPAHFCPLTGFHIPAVHRTAAHIRPTCCFAEHISYLPDRSGTSWEAHGKHDSSSSGLARQSITRYCPGQDQGRLLGALLVPDDRVKYHKLLKRLQKYTLYPPCRPRKSAAARKFDIPLLHAILLAKLTGVAAGPGVLCRGGWSVCAGGRRFWREMDYGGPRR